MKLYVKQGNRGNTGESNIITEDSILGGVEKKDEEVKDKQ